MGRVVSVWSDFSLGVVSGTGGESALGDGEAATGGGVLAGLAAALAPDFGAAAASVLAAAAGVGVGLAGAAEPAGNVGAGAALEVGDPSAFLLAASDFLVAFSVAVTSGAGAESPLDAVGAAPGDGVLAGLAAAPAPDVGVVGASVLAADAGVGFGLTGAADSVGNVGVAAALGAGDPSVVLAASGFLAGVSGVAGGMVATGVS